MSGTLSTNYFEDVEISSNTNTRQSITLSNRIIRRQIGGQFWSMKLSTVPLDRDDYAELYAFLVSQEGSFDSFTFVPPVIGNTRGTAAGTPLVNATYAAGQTLVKGNNGTGTLKKGDFIKFSNHDKVYMLMADVNQDSSSQDFFNIFPGLRTAVDSSTTITYNSVGFKMLLNGDVTTFKTSADNTFQLEFGVREDI
jgi:hypothetical protein